MHHHTVLLCVLAACTAYAAGGITTGSAPLTVVSPSPIKHGNDSYSFVAAVFTSFKPDGSIDLTAVVPQARLLVQTGVFTSFVCGTTGEGASLTVAERKAVLEEWIRAAALIRKEMNERLAIIAHVGANSVADSRDLAQHAEQAGADAFASTAPSYFRPASVQDLVSTVQFVAASAPTLPFYYYHIPILTGINFNMYDFIVAADGAIPNLQGVKFTDYNLYDYARALHYAGGKYEVLYGRDEQMAGAMAMGGTGFVGSTYNYHARLYHPIVEAFAKGDMKSVAAAQARAQEFIAIMLKYGSGAQKAIMKMIGVDVGPMRLPQDTCTPEQAAELRKELVAADLMPWTAAQ